MTTISYLEKLKLYSQTFSPEKEKEFRRQIKILKKEGFNYR